MSYRRPKKKKLLIELEEDQEEMFRQFRIKALEENKTMKGKIIEFVKDYLKEQKGRIGV